MPQKKLGLREFITIIINTYNSTCTWTNKDTVSKELIDLKNILILNKKGLMGFEELKTQYKFLHINFRDIYIYAQSVDWNVNKDGILDSTLIEDLIYYLLSNYSSKEIIKNWVDVWIKPFLFYDNVIDKDILFNLLNFYNRSKFKSDNIVLFWLISKMLINFDDHKIWKLKQDLERKGLSLDNNKNIYFLEKVTINDHYIASDYVWDTIDSLFIYFLYKMVTVLKRKKLSKFQENHLNFFFKGRDEGIYTFWWDGWIRILSLDDKYWKWYESNLANKHAKIYHFYEKALWSELLEKLYIEIEDCSNESLEKNNDNPLCIKKYRVKPWSFELFRDAKNEKFQYHLFNFIYRKHTSNIHSYISEYFKNWKNNKLNLMTGNYLLVDHQIKVVNQYLLELQNKYWTENIKINCMDKQKEPWNEIDYLWTLLYFHFIWKIEILNFYDFSWDLLFKIKENIIFNLKESNDLILSLHGNQVTLYDDVSYVITNSEYKVLDKFLNSKHKQINIMDTSITTNLDSLNKMKLRLQHKLKNKIKINKVRNKNLWYLSK